VSFSVRVSVFILAAIMAMTVVGCSGTSSLGIVPPLEQWAWMSGANVISQSGTYGSEGKTVAGNIPGSRQGAVSWTNPAGNLWLFGGAGVDSTGTQGELNDLWVYSQGQWTWVNGANVANQPGTYGTEGTAAAGNVPGARSGAVRWMDGAGDLWLFGGTGVDSTGTQGELNDLWVYSRGQWTWVSGANVANRPGTYGTEGTAAATNLPGARTGAVSWTDPAGNLWLFGGTGVDSKGTQGALNDLWVYGRGQWTWVSGANAANQPGAYGTEGTAAAANVPGARTGAVSWTDPAGNLWLFGGSGVDSNAATGFLNDLWVYSRGEWTWINGANEANQAGTYGTEGTAAANNVPGARQGAISWMDAGGNLWLFGGMDADDNGTPTGLLNDLWVYSHGQWAWVAGGNTANQPGTYGTLGTPAAVNVPGARTGCVSWTDPAGNLWLLGGTGLASNPTGGLLNDLWVYKP
jgi:N-acetylneuraminic acid mutarotase